MRRWFPLVVVVLGCGRSGVTPECAERSLPPSLPAAGWSLDVGSADSTRVLARFASDEAATSLLSVSAPPGVDGGTFSDCAGCLSLVTCPGSRASCGAAGTRTFHATSGAFTFTHSRVTMFPGTMRGAVTEPAHLVEWDLARDEPLDGGGCVDLTPFTFAASWD